MGVFQILAAIEFIGSRQRALLHLVENDLHVHKLAAAHVNVHTGTKELFRQDGDIKTVGVEARQVASFNVIGNVARHFLECGAVGYIGIVDAMNGRCFGRNGHFGVDTHGFGLLIPVGIYLEVTNFDNSV